MEIFLASGNEHKKREIQELFPLHSFILPKEAGITFNPDENGQSFSENSLIKAEELWNLVRKPVIADDSGICVSVLDNRPGIYSARYCGKDSKIGESALSSSEQNRLLIEEMNYVIKRNNLTGPASSLRKCMYVCSMIFYYDDFSFISAQETMKGFVLESLEQQKGTGGFGYDPIVFLPQFGKTVAELTPAQKNEVSHRGKACALLSPSIQIISRQLKNS